MFQKTNQI